MKNRKKKLCPKCLSVLKYENEKDLKRDFKYACTFCDENFYEFEAVKTKKK